MAYAIRPFQREDAPRLAQLAVESIREIGSHAYNEQQVAAWASRHPDADCLLQRARRGACIWVAVSSEGTQVAFTLLEADGHLDMLYCHPAHTRRGLADQLLAAAEQHARTNGLERLFTEASELARSAFERVGYTVTARRDFAIKHAGQAVPMHNYAMERCLSQDD